MQIQKNEIVEFAHGLNSSCEKCKQFHEKIAFLEREAVNAVKEKKHVDIWVLMLASAKLDLQEHKKEMSA